MSKIIDLAIDSRGVATVEEFEASNLPAGARVKVKTLGSKTTHWSNLHEGLLASDWREGWPKDCQMCINPKPRRY